MVELSSNVDVDIRDFQSSDSALEVQVDGVITALEVSVDIKHSWIGDLRVHLVSPSGRVVALHNRSGRGRDDINETYSTEDHVGLQVMLGEPARGAWTLMVSDHARFDTGHIDGWSLKGLVLGA